MTIKDAIVKYKVKEFYHTPKTANDAEKIDPICSCGYKIYNRITDKLEMIATISNATILIPSKCTKMKIDFVIASIKEDMEIDQDPALDEKINFVVRLYRTNDYPYGSQVSSDFDLNVKGILSAGIFRDNELVCCEYLSEDHNFLVCLFNDFCYQKKKDIFIPKVYDLLASEVARSHSLTVN
jgi:hypothetical protein